jgi:hypothetical protein
MRLEGLLAVLAAALLGLAGSPSASAGHIDCGPGGWIKTHGGYGCVRYVRDMDEPYPDPYAYRYQPRSYYPYVNSGYWRPAAEVRKRNHYHYNRWNVLAPYYRYHPSWGYPKEWHW